MNWTPTTELEIRAAINESYVRMSLKQRRLWEAIKIHPVKWSQVPDGSECNGFWVVALIGNSVIWFNDIEDGFNRSSFKEYGVIEEYLCNQDELEWQVQGVINQMRDALNATGHSSDVQPVA